jgi:hypothetical protein
VPNGWCTRCNSSYALHNGTCLSSCPDVHTLFPMDTQEMYWRCEGEECFVFARSSHRCWLCVWGCLWSLVFRAHLWRTECPSGCRSCVRIGWVVLASDASYGGTWQKEHVPAAYGTFSQLRFVWLRGGITCDMYGHPVTESHPWQACAHVAAYGLEFLVRRASASTPSFVVRQNSVFSIGNGCKAPTTPTGDIFCDASFELGAGSMIIPTWYEPTRQSTLEDNAGEIHVAIYAYRVGLCESLPLSGDPSVTRLLQCTSCEMGSALNITSGRCVPCSRGQESYGNSTACSACRPGFYSDSPGMMCQPCPAGQESNASRSGCIACKVGWHSTTEGSMCVGCAAGTESDDTRTGCVACVDGKYNDAVGGVCQPCPSDRVSDADRSGCRRCRSDLFEFNGTCVSLCPVDTIGVNGSCVSCELGRYSSDGIACHGE